MKKLLVVIDYQNDFVNGALGFPGAELLDEKIAAKVKQYHKERKQTSFTPRTPTRRTT